MRNTTYKHEIWKVKDEIFDLIIKELDEENYFQKYFMNNHIPIEKNIEQFADEVSNRYLNASEMMYVHQFLVVSIYYIICDCNRSDWSFEGLNKMIKTTKKGEFEEESIFETLIKQKQNEKSLLADKIENFRNIERFCSPPENMVDVLPIYIYEWRDEKEENYETDKEKLEKVQKVLEYAKKVFRE